LDGSRELPPGKRDREEEEEAGLMGLCWGDEEEPVSCGLRRGLVAFEGYIIADTTRWGSRG